MTIFPIKETNMYARNQSSAIFCYIRIFLLKFKCYKCISIFIVIQTGLGFFFLVKTAFDIT